MCKVLVIEDDKLIQNNLFDLLTSEEYTVLCANNGIEGIEKVQSFYPDLIICDIMMPELNGFEVIERLQKDNDTAGIPFLFLTAKTDMENLRQGMRLGADDYLLKPFEIDELLESIKTRIRKNNVNKTRIKQMQDQIAHKIPHDLRTPLVPILGYAEMIEGEEDIDEIKKMIKTIRKSGKILHNRIEKFLLYKDLVIREINKSGEMINIIPTEINNELVSFVSSNIPEEYKSPERINVNVEHTLLKINQWYLQIAISELVENSLKYSHKDCQVFINGTQHKNSYELTIKDSGIGMTPNQINSITAFKKFNIDSIPEPGLGLGLAIVQKIISFYGGSLTLSSSIGEYTECKIVLPTV